jgi:hypothetical protein
MIDVLSLKLVRAVGVGWNGVKNIDGLEKSYQTHKDCQVQWLLRCGPFRGHLTLGLHHVSLGLSDIGLLLCIPYSVDSAMSVYVHPAKGGLCHQKCGWCRENDVERANELPTPSTLLMT